jgi:hypothetical protein
MSLYHKGRSLPHLLQNICNIEKYNKKIFFNFTELIYFLWQVLILSKKLD